MIYAINTYRSPDCVYIEERLDITSMDLLSGCQFIDNYKIVDLSVSVGLRNPIVYRGGRSDNYIYIWFFVGRRFVIINQNNNMQGFH